MEDFVEAMLRAEPDPIDVFEDRLAARLGLERGPGLSQMEWRERRVAFIDSFVDAEIAETAAAVEREIYGSQEAG